MLRAHQDITGGATVFKSQGDGVDAPVEQKNLEVVCIRNVARQRGCDRQVTMWLS